MARTKGSKVKEKHVRRTSKDAGKNKELLKGRGQSQGLPLRSNEVFFAGGGIDSRGFAYRVITLFREPRNPYTVIASRSLRKGGACATFSRSTNLASPK